MLAHPSIRSFCYEAPHGPPLLSQMCPFGPVLITNQRLSHARMFAIATVNTFALQLPSLMPIRHLIDRCLPAKGMVTFTELCDADTGHWSDEHLPPGSRMLRNPALGLLVIAAADCSIRNFDFRNFTRKCGTYIVEVDTIAHMDPI